MGFAENRPAAPRAAVGAATRRDERHRANAVPLPPGMKVAGHIDRIAIGKRLRVQVWYQRACRRPHDRAIIAAKRKTRNLCEIFVAPHKGVPYERPPYERRTLRGRRAPLYGVP